MKRFGAILALLSIVVAAGVGLRYVLCHMAAERVHGARIGLSTVDEARDAMVDYCRYCGSTPEARIDRSIAAVRAGALPEIALKGLGDTPAERRAGAVIRMSAAGWKPESVRAETPALGGAEGECIGAIAAFNGGAVEAIAFPISVADEPCALVLRGSARLERGELDAARPLFARADPRMSARLGSAAIELNRGDHVSLDSALVNASRATVRSPEELSGLWLASSWRPLPGEAGRLTTPLDQEATLVAILQGDVAAMRGGFEVALSIYRREFDRGVRIPDLAARLIDVELAASNPQGAGVLLAAAAERTPDAEPLLARRVLVLIARKELEQATRAIEAVRNPVTARALAEEIEDARSGKDGRHTRKYAVGRPSKPRPVRVKPEAGSTRIVSAPAPSRGVDASEVLAEAKRRIERGRLANGIYVLERAEKSDPRNEELIYGAWKLCTTRDRQMARRFGWMYLERFPGTARTDEVRAWLKSSS